MSVIYKISCKDLNVKECYFGSTKDFNKRKVKHKCSCYKENSKAYNYPLYQFIRLNGGWQNWSMNVIEEIDTVDKEIIKKCERKYIGDNIDIVLNKEIPGRTNEEYRENNKKKIIEKAKAYRENNRKKIRENAKIYHENNKDEINRKARERYHKKKIDSK